MQTMKRSGYATASAILFALLAIVQALRAATGIPVEIDGRLVPYAASWAIAVFATLMAAWGWRSR
jgi:hypothetical protein